MGGSWARRRFGTFVRSMEQGKTVKTMGQPDVKELAKYVFSLFDVLGIKKKAYAEIADDQLIRLVEIANQGIGVLESKVKEHLGLDFESQSWAMEVEAIKQRLVETIDGCKGERQRRAFKKAGEPRVSIGADGKVRVEGIRNKHDAWKAAEKATSVKLDYADFTTDGEGNPKEWIFIVKGVKGIAELIDTACQHAASDVIKILTDAGKSLPMDVLIEKTGMEACDVHERVDWLVEKGVAEVVDGGVRIKAAADASKGGGT